MRQARRDRNLATKTFGADGGTEILMEDLYRYTALVSNVAGKEDSRHTALSQLTLYVISITESSLQPFEQLVQIRISIWRPVPKDTIER